MLLSSELVIRYMAQAKPFERALYLPSFLTERDVPLRWRYSPTDGRNSLGLRNRELGPKETGTYRVLFLGDSLIWSGETTSGKLYTEILEHRLNTRCPNNVNSVEVINAGIPGYTTYQELEFLKIYGIDMEPDLVMLGFVFNDVYYKYLHKPTKQKRLDIEPTIVLNRFNTEGFPGNIFAKSYLAHGFVYMSEMVWKRVLGCPVFPFQRQWDFYLAWKSYGWREVRNLIGEMQTLLVEMKVPLIIVVFPIDVQVDDRYRNLDEAYVLYPQGKIQDICDHYTIPMLNLTQPIYRNGGTTLFRDYLHLNAKGNDIVAIELEKYLASELNLTP